VKRLPEEKWFLSRAEYANDTYPPFAVGQLYVPQSSINAVLQAAKQITIHWLDDVFIGGQIPQFLKMTLIHIYERTNLWEVESLPCYANKYFIIHATPAQKKRLIYYESCMQSYRQETCRTHLQLQEEPFQELIDSNGDETSSATTKAVLTIENAASRIVPVDKDILGMHTKIHNYGISKNPMSNHDFYHPGISAVLLNNIVKGR
jgi:hypothetical protein